TRLRAALASTAAPPHAARVHTGQRSLYNGKVRITNPATIHEDRLRLRRQVPASGVPVPEPMSLIYVWCNDFRERVPGPVKAGFDRSEIALCDLRNLLVGLALELTQDEHIPVMLGELGHALLDDLSQMALPIHVIRTGGRIFELKRTILILEVFLNGLKENQRITRAVAQLVLRQIRRDRVDPRGELLRAI